MYVTNFLMIDHKLNKEDHLLPWRLSYTFEVTKFCKLFKSFPMSMEATVNYRQVVYNHKMYLYTINNLIVNFDIVFSSLFNFFKFKLENILQYLAENILCKIEHVHVWD